MKGRSEISVSAVFDIETEHWDQFVAGGLLIEGKVYREYTEEKSLVDALLSIDGSIWAHNGGRFDLLWLADHIAARGLKAQVALAGSRIVKLEVGKSVFRDSFALVPLALKDAAGIGGTEKLELGFRCSCGEDCGGYCRIKRKGMRRAERRQLSEYLRQDCESLDKTLARLRGFAEQEDLDLCGTIGMSAWKTIQRWLDIPDAEWPTNQVYRQCREAYFGGRVQVFRPNAAAGWRYDINSAYPAALVETPIPYGQRNFFQSEDARAWYERDREGVYRAAVKTSEDLAIPCLPVRSRERVVYPTGAFQGWWTGLELREAERLGCKVEILGGHVWMRSDTLLAAFCAQVWKLRAGLGKKHPLAKWLKWFANAPTGKLAQRPESERVKFIGDYEDRPRMCQPRFDCQGNCGFDCCEHKCTHKCGGWRPLDRAMRLWRRTVWRLPSSGYVHWAAYLTSAARIKTGRQLRADDDGASAVYCDTDSCFATKERHENVGQDLGQWNPEGAFEDFCALAPKVYRYKDESGQWHVRAKGIPDAGKHWAAISSHAPVQIDRGVSSFLQTAGKEKFFMRRNFHRAIHENRGMYGDRKLHLKDGRTYPMSAEFWRNKCRVKRSR